MYERKFQEIFTQSDNFCLLSFYRTWFKLCTSFDRKLTHPLHMHRVGADGIDKVFVSCECRRYKSQSLEGLSSFRMFEPYNDVLPCRQK